ncbi:response regulator [Actinophytocola glycyrrhizae]|uniref:Response regulator n=1 Tax=Actinophytocola glycyrrhizae TaxID=2044873 RepID=A0ABV9S868_9PSEU
MRIVLAEDSTLLREGLVRLLAEEGHDVVSAVADGESLVEVTGRELPDVVVTDVRMPPTHTDEGLRAALSIQERWPQVGVLVLSQYVETRYAGQLLGRDQGKVGYLLKDRVTQVGEFLDALSRVAEGGAAFDPEVVRRLVSRTSKADPLTTLTERELEVLKMMAEGHTNNAIAKRMHVSRSGVEKFVNSIFYKLGIGTDSEYHRRVLAILRYLAS